MNLWPTNLFPLSLLGIGLRLASLIRDLQERFSGRVDPKRVFVAVLAEPTAIAVEAQTTLAVLDDPPFAVISVPDADVLVATAGMESSAAVAGTADLIQTEVPVLAADIAVDLEPSMVTL